MKKSRTGWYLLCLAAAGVWCAAAVADEVARPWGTVHGNIYGTQSAADPSIKFSDKWYAGAVKDWEVDLRSAEIGLDRLGGRGSITFDEAGNLYFRSSTGGATGGTARVASFSPKGVLRWKGTTDGSTLIGLGTFRHTSVVVGDGGPSGRCYVLGVTGAGPVAIALSKATGVQVWQTPIPSAEADITPVLYDGKLFILGNAVGGATPFYALDSATGAVLGSSSIAVGTGSNGQMTLVPNAFGAGKHGLYYNVDRAMNAVLVDTTGASITASLAWTAPGGNTGRSHVNYFESIGRLVTHTYPDADTFPFHAWNLDGTGAVGYRPLAGWGDGFYDFAAIDFNGTDLLAGGSEGKIIRYKNIRTYVEPGPPGPVVVLYDSEGFEAPKFTLGALNGQDGWVGAQSGTGIAPQVVDATGGNQVEGNQAVRLEVADVSGDTSSMERALDDAIAAGYTIITVSFDVYRESASEPNENLWWWADGNNPLYGLQWDIDGTMPNGWNAGAGSAPTIKDRWANLTMQWNAFSGKASSWYDGVAVDTDITITGINEFIGWYIGLAHDAGTGSGPEVCWIDNLVITGQAPGTPGSPGTPESDGYYQFTPYYGDQRLLGGLYKNSAGKSIMVLGTRGNNDPNRGPLVDSFVYAANLTDGTLITSCLDYQDSPLIVDNFQIVGDVSGVVFDTAGFEGYTVGNMAGQANPGGTGSLDANNWQDDNYGTGGQGTPVQIAADPTSGGHGNVVVIQPNGSCGGTKGIKGKLAMPTTTDNVVTVSWDQYRGDLTDNVWYDAQETAWYAMQWDSNKSINAVGNGGPWVPLTAGTWQHIEYAIDLINQSVTVTVDGSATATAFIDPANFMSAVYGWSWRQEATSASSNVPQSPQIFAFDTGMVDWFYDTHGGPQMGPLTPGVAPQHIYYTNRENGKLVAIGPACNKPPQDLDGDNDVDLGDFNVFQACFNGPNRPAKDPSDARCACVDSEDDGDVDLADFGILQGCFNGPNRPAKCL